MSQLNSIPPGYVLTGYANNQPQYAKMKRGQLPPEVTAKSTMGGQPVKPRIRQSSKPLMNKLETRFMAHMKRKHLNTFFHPQGITFRLANGLRYTPDFTAFLDGELFAYEVKGGWIDGDSIPKIKMFASLFPEWTVLLCWERDGEWQQQLVKP